MKFKEGDKVVVLPRNNYRAGKDSRAGKWEGVVTTVKRTNDASGTVDVDCTPFNTPADRTIYVFDKTELELAKDYWLDEFSKQL